MNKKIIFIIVSILLLPLISIPIKADCEMIEGDVVERQIEADLTNLGVGESAKFGEVTVTVTGIDPSTGAKTFTFTGQLKDAGSYDMNSASTGKDAYYDGRESNTHSGDTKNVEIGDNKFADTNIDANGKMTGSGTTSTGTQKGKILQKAAEAIKGGANFNNAEDRVKFLESTNLKPGTVEWEKRDADLKNSNNDKNKLIAMAAKDNGKSTSTINYKIQKLPTQVCTEDPGTDLCDQHAQRQPQSFPGHNGTCTSRVGSCIKSERQDYLSSYTTSSPNLSDPTIIKRDMCGPHIRQYNETLTMTQMNQLSGSIQANQRNNQDKLQALVDQFRLPTWTSKWQLEAKYWNPFQEGVISPGLPVKKHMTIELDSWLDREYSINNILKESVNIWKAAKERNSSVVRKYNGNVDIDVFNNAPNPVVKHRYLDGREWKEINSRVIECQETYELKIEPRYDITIHNRYQKVQQRDIVGATKIVTYNCDPYEELVCETRYKPPWKRESEDDRYEEVCHHETRYHTCCRTVPDDQHQEWPDGETGSSSSGGSIPPIYAPRVKWTYRIGVDNEYHATAYKTTPQARLRPIPNSNGDESTIKSGYGFNYSADRWRVITDYDNPQFNSQSDLVRPNKTTNIRLNRSLEANTQNFDPDVRFDSARNAPNRSSSKNSRYINERIRANIVNSTFDRDLISRFVSPNEDDPSIMRLQRNTGPQSSVSGGRITRNGSAIQMETEFEASSDPNRYYHAYWVTRGEPNLIPAYRPGPLHYIHLDYRSGSDYDVYSMNRVVIRPGFTIDAFNSGSIRVVGNMWEDSFSRPDVRKSGNLVFKFL
ncbi:MAG: hypothetical protein MSH08_02005 [Ezakiella sp.]|nr:hypothetical protein [Ezakiella sp.]MDD7472237.1 hypothetical protein [Bacillota bacterium]